MLDQSLVDTKTDALVPKAIIAPNAGYIYSGSTTSACARLKKAITELNDRPRKPLGFKTPWEVFKELSGWNESSCPGVALMT